MITQPRRRPMSLDRAIMAFAGVMILLSIVLTQVVSPWVWLMTAFIGFCPAGMVMKRMGIGRGADDASCCR